MIDISIDNNKNILTADDARKILGVGKTTIYRLLAEKQIQHFYIGKAIRIPKSALIEFIQNSCYNEDATRQSVLPDGSV